MATGTWQRSRPKADAGGSTRRGSAAAWLGLALAVAGFAGCGSAPEPDAAGTVGAARAPEDASAAPSAPAPQDHGGVPPLERAQAALQEQRMFLPAGDNAFELFLQAREASPDDARARQALQDLFPYAVLNVEQRLAARDRAEAARMLALMAQAQPDAPALPRLQRSLDTLTATLAREAAATEAAELAAQEAAAASRAAAVQAAREPAPAPAPVVARNEAPPPEVAVPAPAMGSITPASSVAEPAIAEAELPAARPLPKVLRQVTPRYPHAAGRRKTGGRVELAFTITAAGRVADVEILKSEPPGVFDRAAIDAIEDWRYEATGESMRAARAFEFRWE